MLIDSIRHAMVRAFGMGTGSHISAGHGHRGKVLRLSDEAARVFAFRWGVILTEPVYSAQQRWQVIVPIVRDARAPTPNDVEVVVRAPSGPAWLAEINPAWTGAVLSCALVCSVSHLDGHVDRIHTATVDDGTLAAVESELRARFALA